jgi:hypothetical protein
MLHRPVAGHILASSMPTNPQDSIERIPLNEQDDSPFGRDRVRDVFARSNIYVTLDFQGGWIEVESPERVRAALNVNFSRILE